MVMLWKYNNIKYKIYQGMKQLKRCKIKLVPGEEEEEEEEEEEPSTTPSDVPK
jgi:hypothetical protein